MFKCTKIFVLKYGYLLTIFAGRCLKVGRPAIQAIRRVYLLIHLQLLGELTLVMRQPDDIQTFWQMADVDGVIAVL